MTDISMLLVFSLCVCPHIPGTGSVEIRLPAEIVSGDGQRDLSFSVGSEILLRCRLTPWASDWNVSNISSLYMTFSKDMMEDVPLNVTVVEDSVQFVVYNATPQHSGSYYCSSAGGLLASEEVVVGYIPTDDFRVVCRLHSEEDVQCCVRIDDASDEHALGMNPVHVSWSMQMMSPHTAPEVKKADDKTLCATWTLEDVTCGNGFTVIANASNKLGFALSNLSFCPLKVVQPGPVVNLNVSSQLPDKLRMTWYHPEDLSLSRRHEMGGVSYSVDVYPFQHGQAHVYTTDFKQDGETVDYSVEGLLPFTWYYVTVTSHSRCCAGPGVSVTIRTAESAPLAAPEVIAWAQGQAGTVIYLNGYTPETQGGVITEYSADVCTDKTSCQSVKQQAASPLVLKGCEQGCNARIKAATSKGSSNESSALEIPPSYSKSTVKQVEVERKAKGLHAVFWEKSSSVVSIHWCYGSPFPEDPSLIHCQITVRSAVASQSFCHQLVNVSEADRNAYPETIDKRWHFGVGIASYDHLENSNGSSIKASVPVQILWESCLFDENGALPQPVLHVRAWENGTGLTLKTGSWCTTTVPPPGKPHNATVSTVAEKHQNCSAGTVLSGSQLLVDKRAMEIGGLIPGHSYKICVTYYNSQGKESVTEEEVLTASRSEWTSFVGHPDISVTILVVIFTVLGLFILVLVCRVGCVVYKKKSSHFQDIQWPQGKKIQLKECCPSKPKSLTSDKRQTLAEFQVAKDGKVEVNRQDTSSVMTRHTNNLTMQQTNLIKKTRTDSLKTYINHSDLSTFGCMTPEVVPLLSGSHCTVSIVGDDQQANNVEVTQRDACSQETAVLSDVETEGLGMNQNNNRMMDVHSHASQQDSAVKLCTASLGRLQFDGHRIAYSPGLGGDICNQPSPNLLAQYEHDGGRCVDIDKVSELRGGEECAENSKLMSFGSHAATDLGNDYGDKLQMSLFEPAFITKHGCLSTTSSKGYVKLTARDPTIGDSGALCDTRNPSTGSPKALATDEMSQCSFPPMVSVHFLHLHKTTEKTQETYVKSPALTPNFNITFKESGYVQPDSGMISEYLERR